MPIETLTSFFGWMVVLNLGGILLMFVALWRFPDRIARINNRLFGISTGEAQSTFFGLFYLWRVLFVLFVLIPYVALLLIT